VPAAERRFGQAPLKAPLDERVVIAMGLAIAKGVAAYAGSRGRDSRSWKCSAVMLTDLAS